MLKKRLTDAINATGGLSDNQYGFRKGRSTIGAIQEVVETVRMTRQKSHGSRPLVLLAALDGRWNDELDETTDKRPKTVDRTDFGGVDFYLTQFLTGHGYFRHYLYRMGKVRTADCIYCGHDRDDSEHTFFVCPRWSMVRRTLEAKTGSISPDNIVAKMLQDRVNWTRVGAYIDSVLRRKKEDGCLV